MLKTEDDAKQCWCPFARVSATGLGNRYPMDIDLAKGHAFARCIASQCMAWRWAGDGGWRVDGTVHALPQDDGAEQVGYCGLAGKPEA